MRAEDQRNLEAIDRRIERWALATRQLAEEMLRERSGPTGCRERATRVALALEQARLLVESITEGRVMGVTLS